MNDTLNDLKKELAKIKTDFSHRINEIEQQIIFFETPLDKQPIAQVAPVPDLKVEIVAPLINKKPQLKKKFNKPLPEPVKKTEDQPLKKNKNTVITSLTENSLPMFEPITAIFVKFFAAYKHYHSQGKAPVFFMTLAGILTLVMGFGYLLQYSFSQFLGPFGKIAMGFIASFGISLCGILINRKRTDMADYASSLIGLGIILSYLCAYFTGSFYNLISEVWSFLLLAAITGIAYVLALTFKTKIVAIISLLGGTFAPLLMAQAGQSYHVYLAYVLFLVIAMLHLSRQIHWQVLAHTSMIVSFLVIEYIFALLPALPQVPMGLVLIIHLFFYVFSIYNSFEILRVSAITKTIIVLFSSNIFFYLFSLNQIVYGKSILGGIYMVNALILAAVFFSIPLLGSKTMPSCKNALQMVTLLSIGLLAGFGILALIGPDFLGLAWGVEALVLLYMGSRFNIIQVRIEAHIILMLSFLFSAYHAFMWIAVSIVPPPEIFQLHFRNGWMNLMLTSTLLWSYVLLMERNNNHLVLFEKTWLKIGNEVLSIFISLSFLLTIGIIWAQGIWLFSIVPIFYLIYRARKKHLQFTEYFGLSHFFLLLVPMMTSAQIANSFFFSEQIVLGKISRMEAFFCLFLIAEFYRQYHKQSQLYFFAQILGQAFFCIIPIFFLPGIWHHYIYFFPLAVWFSAGICLALFCWLKSPALIMELKLIVIGSSIISIIACALVKFAGWEGYGTLSLTTGLAFFSVVLFVWKGFIKDPQGSETFLFIREKLRLFFTLPFYYLGIFLFIIVFGSIGSAPLALTLMIGYFYFLFVKLPLFEPLENNFILLYVIVLLSSSLMILTHLTIYFDGSSPILGINNLLFRYGIFNIIVLIFAGLLVHQPLSHFKKARNHLGGHFQLWGFHCLTFITYIGALGQWFNKGFGPALSVALVLHATIVLFLTLKPGFQRLISIAVVLFVMAAGKIIFWDMNDFSLIQKVIAFIIIGSLLLVAAYQYQKMKTAVLESERT